MKVKSGYLTQEKEGATPFFEGVAPLYTLKPTKTNTAYL